MTHRTLARRIFKKTILHFSNKLQATVFFVDFFCRSNGSLHTLTYLLLPIDFGVSFLYRAYLTLRVLTTMESAYTCSAKEVLDHFQVDEQNGLSGSQVQEALQKYGRNCMRSVC